MGVKSIGKIRPTLDGNWDITRRYDRLCIVSVDNEDAYGTYCSKIEVPPGVPITNEVYWQLILKVTSSGTKIFLSQELGTNKEIGMSQDAITRELKLVENKIEDIEEFKAYVRQAIDDLNYVFRSLNDKLNAQAAILDSHTNSITENRNSIAALTNQLAGLVQSVNSLSTNFGSFKQTTENNMNKLNNNISGIDNTLDSITIDV